MTPHSNLTVGHFVYRLAFSTSSSDRLIAARSSVLSSRAVHLLPLCAPVLSALLFGEFCCLLQLVLLPSACWECERDRRHSEAVFERSPDRVSDTAAQCEFDCRYLPPAKQEAGGWSLAPQRRGMAGPGWASSRLAHAPVNATMHGSCDH